MTFFGFLRWCWHRTAAEWYQLKVRFYGWLLERL